MELDFSNLASCSRDAHPTLTPPEPYPAVTGASEYIPYAVELSFQNRTSSIVIQNGVRFALGETETQ